MGPEAGVGGLPTATQASLAAGIQENRLPPKCPPGELATPQHPHSACRAPCARPGAGLRGGRWQVPPQAVALCLLVSLSSGWWSSVGSQGGLESGSEQPVRHSFLTESPKLGHLLCARP